MLATIRRFVNLPFRHHLVIGLLIRLLLILYGEFHDHYSIIPYTDVDYRVFTDAARLMVDDVSPYKRDTYRYSPLIAMMMIPNVLINQNFGKVIFSIFDILVGMAIKKLVVENKILLADGKDLDMNAVHKTAAKCALCWIYNPLAIVITTRGNADTVTSFLIIMSLLFHQTEIVKGPRKYFLAGSFLGFAIHLRLYPIIFSLPMFFSIAEYKITRSTQLFSDLYQLIPNYNQLNLVTGCLWSLIFVTTTFHNTYGNEFIFQSYIYHFIRKDTRHNFSMYFYLQYLSDENAHFWHRSGPLVVLLMHIGVRYGKMKTLNFALFLEVTILVAYNTVLTSQYFVWYLSLIPLCISDIDIKWKKGVYLCCLWLATQAAWLYSAYNLEFKGKNVFVHLWVESILFFMAHLYIIVEIVKAYTPRFIEDDETILLVHSLDEDPVDTDEGNEDK